MEKDGKPMTQYIYLNSKYKKYERQHRNWYYAKDIITDNDLFWSVYKGADIKYAGGDSKYKMANINSKGKMTVNILADKTTKEWCYIMAHCLLHMAFGHFDKEHMPEGIYDSPEKGKLLAVWNKACDIYVTRFLYDIKFGSPICNDPAEKYSIKLDDEKKIYNHLLEIGDDGSLQEYGTSSIDVCDMVGIDKPTVYKDGINPFVESFNKALVSSMSQTISTAGNYVYDEKKNTPVAMATRWFIANYPLLGSMAASYRVIEDTQFCIKHEIEIAAVDAVKGELYINPACGFSMEEWKFVLAHEFLHAGLMHHKRAKGRNHYLWNVACDYVINGWLYDMGIGKMPSKGLLYDEELKGLSAEAIYDRIEKDIKKYLREATFRGYKKGDIISDVMPTFGGLNEGIGLDEFYKNSLREGLDYHNHIGRGFIPAGLIEEIYALSMPPIPWDVELGKWFDEYFPPIEKHRTYARPSRRQSSTPNIPRPRAIPLDFDENSRTFGVVLDTSGSMSPRMIGKALGSIASYAISKDVHAVRVVFCDARAYDMGYMSPEEVAGKVEVKGRGGTIIQPAVSLLEKAKDFPQDAPILIITDGFIEDRLIVHHEHAYLIPKGNRLPFKPKSKVFYFE